MESKPKILSVNISEKKGTIKHPVDEIELNEMGVIRDAHAGPWGRQVSLLARESIAKFEKEMGRQIKHGEFAENITTEGIDLVRLPIGTEIHIGRSVILRVTQIGKECHERCAIYYQAGDCVMPKEGIFAEVIKEGELKVGDEIIIDH